MIVAIDGNPVGSVREASKAIEAAKPGQQLDFRVNVDGTIEHARFTRRRCVPNDPRRLVGVSLLNPFPFPVSIDSGDIGGPSAGLMWALGLYELMTPGDLTGGRTIAGTGTIDLQGPVGPIGGIRDKVVAAQRAGASIFLAPADDMADSGWTPGAMRVISVATFADALQALQAWRNDDVK